VAAVFGGVCGPAGRLEAFRRESCHSRAEHRLDVQSAHPERALREAREYAAVPLPAQTARQIAPEALITLEFRGLPVHDPVHAGAPCCYVP
jgi:hypothetical protein